MVSVRVVRATRFGGPEVLVAGEAPEPEAARGQAVVDVSVVDVLFLETQIRRGAAREWFPETPPYVPGGGVAGVVRAVGPGVESAWIGRRVLAGTGTHGGYAERAVVDAELLVSVPDGVGLREAAALLHDGPTAVRLAELAEIRPDEWVLVLGAAGGLGVLLVQRARAAGARVIGAARGERKLALAARWGAEAVVDYAEEGWTDRVRAITGSHGVDVVFDGVGACLGEAAFGLTARGGRFSAHGTASGGFADVDRHAAAARGVVLRGIEQVQFAPREAAVLMAGALAEAEAGRLTPVIGAIFPLAAAADAHAAVEARAVTGKTLLLTRGGA